VVADELDPPPPGSLREPVYEGDHGGRGWSSVYEVTDLDDHQIHGPVAFLRHAETSERVSQNVESALDIAEHRHPC